KYHGLADFERRIPYHASISVCTSPTATHTTLEANDSIGEDSIEIDGKVLPIGRERERALKVLDAVRGVSQSAKRVRMVSKSNFRKYVGLGSSASGFAALAVAACKVFGVQATTDEVSEFARLGAGSATRAVAGGFAEWVTRGMRSYGRMLAGPGEIPWTTIAMVTHHDVPTEGVHRDAMTSPFFRARLDYIEKVLEQMRLAVQRKEPLKMMELAERDTLNLHAVTMTSKDGLVAWRGATVETIHAVRRLRAGGTPCYFSIDTGATVYVNTLPEHADEVEKMVEGIDGVDEVMRLDVGPGARLVENHLF
ncbi:MAG TPA: diphosphomevalonate decarboxylase, partial [Candidatus Thermoplasmatota archaeon]|nr:diphosphomevalonate decarboxylase [Candidatus Thermoplasmatota archaeon]